MKSACCLFAASIGSPRSANRNRAIRVTALRASPAGTGAIYLVRPTSLFLAPASGKTHMAATISTAVTITKVAKSGRIGEPLQNDSTPATSSTMAERTALTSYGAGFPEIR
jgi:hypothetical protein